MPKFLIPGSSKGGADSRHNDINPPKSSLIFITAIVNKYKEKILIDTGATTTFVNEKVLFRMTPRNIRKQSGSFVLADGLAPFQVLGLIHLTIEFGDTMTEIQAYVARALCTDMIIGMDYINKYNLNIDVKRQIVSIENLIHTFTMFIDKNLASIKLPLTSSEAIRVPPHSNRMALVQIPVSSINTPFFIHEYQQQNNSLTVTHTFQKFHRYSSKVMLSNTSSYPQFID